MDDIRFGVKLPFGGDKTHEDTARIARAAEENGLDAAWHSEHVVFTGEVPDDYPYTGSGTAPFSTDQNAYEVFETLSYLAAVTDDIRLGTNICIAPLRHPVLLTKQAMTLDNLADGRFDFGLSVGWLRTEFESLGVPFEQRGSRTDEFLEVWSRACETDEFSFDGTHHSFPTTGFNPRPVQDGGPPVWIGGESGATFRRIGQYGDGWMATSIPVSEFESGVGRMRNAWTDYEREGEPAVAIKESMWIGEVPDGIEPLMAGSADDVIDDIETFVDAGATMIVGDFRRTEEAPIRRFSTEEQIEQIERLGDEVIPHFRD
jgi:probable F420-dependent oxidoreductase